MGGSKDLDTTHMEISSSVCGHTESIGPEQAIMCELTSVRLVSHGDHNNQVVLTIRSADENDIEKATLICAL